jgi:hypothetical protein
VIRPDKLSAKIRGDAPPFDFYFDGSRMTVYEPAAKLYATEDAPDTIDALLPFAAKRAGIILPFADMLYSDPYAALSDGVAAVEFSHWELHAPVKLDSAAGPGVGANEFAPTGER